MAFEPITASVSIFGPEDIGSETKRFIQGADDRTLDGTLYQAPDKEYDSWFVDSARDIILNRGDLEAGSKRLENADQFKEFLERRGANVFSYSSPESSDRVHAKLYTADFDGNRELFISTSNLSKASIGDSFYKQVNFAFRIRDQNIVKQADYFLQQIRQGSTRPVSTENFLTGGSVQSGLEKRAEKLGKGDKLILTSPYLDSARTVKTLIEAKKRGVEVVTVVDKEVSKEERDGNSSYKNRSKMKATLKKHGIKVLEADSDDPLLYHSKSVAAIDDDAVDSFLMHGSDNFTDASFRVSSLDVMLTLDDDKLAKEYYNKIEDTITDYDLEKSKPSEKPISLIELTMQARGLGGIYRRSFRNVSYGEKLEERSTGEEIVNFEGSLPFYPSTLPEHYFQALRKTKLPTLDVYSRLYKSRTGESEAPGILEEADRILEAPGLGERVNRLLGFELYREGSGVVGSLFRGVGKIFDYAFGYEAYDLLNRQREGDFEGSLAKYQRNEIEPETYTGPFEKIFNTTFNLMSGTALAAGAYVGLNLPFQHFMANALQKSLDELILAREVEAKPSMFSKGMKKVRQLFRLGFFGAGQGTILNEELEGGRPSEINRRIKQRFQQYDSHFSKLEVEDGVARVAKRGANEFGFRAAISGMRRYDKSAFDILLRPIFEAISPYDLSKANLDEASPAKAYVQALDKLSETIGKAPEIVFNDTQAVPGQAAGLSLSNIGRDRVVAIAKAWDTLGASIPANIAYWNPAIREALKLPEFDPKTNLTIRDVISFEVATHWTQQYVDTLKEFVTKPISSLKDTLKIWHNESRLRLYERDIAKTIKASSIKAGKLDADLIDKIDDSSIDSVTKFQSLKEALETKQKEFTQSTYDFLIRDHKVQEYTKLVEEQDKLLRRRGHTAASYRRNVESQTSSTGGLGEGYKKTGQNLAQLIKSRRTLITIGGALIANRLMDDFFIKKQEISGITRQAKMWDALNTEDGQIAAFYFSGSVPVSVSAMVALGVGVTTGFAIPKEVDAFQDSKLRSTPGTVAGELQLADYELGRQQRGHLAKVAGGMDATADVIESELSSHRKDSLKVAVDHAPKLKARRRLKFNSMAAVAGGLIGMVGIKGVYAGASYLANFFSGNSDFWGNRRGPTPDSILGVVSSIAESMIPADRAEISKMSARDQAMIAVISQLSAENLKDSKAQRSRTYNVAHQITSPFLQVAVVSRTDGEKTTFGVGFQLMPITGLGISPTLPFGIALKEPNANEKSKDSGAERLIDSLTMPWFSYMPNSNYEQMGMFLGASTWVGIAGAKLKETFKSNKLLSSNSPTWLLKELDGIKALVKPLAPFSKLAIEVPYKLTKSVSSLPFVAGEAFLGGIHSAFTGKESSTRLPIQPSGSGLKAISRRVAPYYLAIATSRMLADYYMEADQEENEFSNTSVAEVSATLTAGLLTGAVLDYSGVFATVDELALATYGDDLTKSPNAAVADRMSQVKSRRFLRVPGRDTFFRQITGDAEQFKQAIISAPKGAGPKLATTKFKSMGGRVALGFAVLFGIRALSAMAVSGYSELSSQVTGDSSKSRISGLYNLPLLGPMLRVLSGVDPRDKSDFRPATGKHLAAKDGILNAISGAASAVFGKDLARMIGLYSDTPDPFFGIPFGGFSFKDSGVAFYLQFASSSSDFSSSAFDLVQRSASLSDVISWRSLLEDGPPKNFRQFYERARGGNLRTRGARYKTFSSYELNAIASSGGLARSLQIKNYQVENLSYQFPNEILMDFLLTGYMRGKFGSTVLPDGKLTQVYDPFSILAGGIIGVIKKGKDGKPEVDESQAIEQTVLTWLHGSTFGRNENVKRFNPLIGFFSDTSEISKLGSPDPISSVVTKIPWLVGSIGVLGSLAFSLGMFSLRQNQSEYSKVYESSKLVRNVSIFKPSAYTLEAITDADGKFQLYQKYGKSSTYHIPVDFEGVYSAGGKKKINTIEANKLASKISTKHKSLINSVNSFFMSTSTGHNLNSLINELVSESASEEAVKKFRENFKKAVATKVQRGLGSKVHGDRNLYSVFFSVYAEGGALPELKGFMEGALDNMLDEMVDSVVDVAKSEVVISAGEDSLKVAYLKQALEESKATREFVSILEMPNPTPLSPEDTLKVNRNLHQEARQQAKLNVTKVYSEGVAKATWNAGIAVGRGVIWWSFAGRELYSTIEAVTLLSDDSKSPFVRKAAAKQLVRSGLFGLEALGVSAGVAYGAAALGLSLSPASIGLLSIGGLLALGAVKNQYGGALRKIEENIISKLSDFVYDPIENIAEGAEKIGLGGIVRAVGKPLGKLTQKAMGLLTSPIRFITDNITGPFLVQKQIEREKASLGWQIALNFLLPESAYYGALAFEPGRQTFQGTEPFIYGNPTRYWAYMQANSIRQASSINSNPEDWFVHSEVLGRFSGFKQQQQYFRQFRGYAGGRILSEFNNDSSYLSSRLRQELKIKQSLLDFSVTSAPLRQMKDPDTFSGAYAMNAVIRSWMGWKLPENQTSVYQSLRQTTEKTLDLGVTVGLRSLQAKEIAKRALKIDVAQNVAKEAATAATNLAKKHPMFEKITDGIQKARTFMRKANVMSRRKFLNKPLRLFKKTKKFLSEKVEKFTNAFLDRVDEKILWLRDEAAPKLYVKTYDFIKNRKQKVVNFLNENMELESTFKEGIELSKRDAKKFFEAQSQTARKVRDRVKHASKKIIEDKIPAPVLKRSRVTARKARVITKKLKGWLFDYSDPVVPEKAADALPGETPAAASQAAPKSVGDAAIEQELIEKNRKIDKQNAVRQSKTREGIAWIKEKTTKATGKIPKFLKNSMTFVKGGFALMDVLMSLQADSRVDELRKNEHGGFYRVAYADQYASAGSSYATLLASNLRVNPIASIGAALAGVFFGSKIGSMVGADAYQNRYDDNKKRNRFIQSATSVALGWLGQAPTLFRALSHGNYKAAAARAGTTLLLGGLSGGLGFGAAAQATFLTYGAQLSERVFGSAGIAKGTFAVPATSKYGVMNRVRTAAAARLGKNSPLYQRVAGAISSKFGHLIDPVTTSYRSIVRSRGVLGRAVRSTMRFMKGPGGKIAGKAFKAGVWGLRILGPVLDAVDVKSGYEGTKKARTQRQLVEAQKNYTSGLGGLAGLTVGAGAGLVFGGPIALVAGLTALVGRFVTAKAGPIYAKRALERNVRLKDLAKSQAKGTTIGTLAGGALGVVGGLALFAAGVVSLPVVAGLALIGLGVGALSGYFGGSEAAFIGKGQKKAKKKKKSTKREEAVIISASMGTPNIQVLDKSKDRKEPKEDKERKKKKQENPTKNPAKNKQTNVLNNIVNFVRGFPKPENLLNNESFSDKQSSKKAKNTVMLASAMGSDTPFLTDADFNRQFGAKKKAYEYLNNTGYDAIEEYEKEIFDPEKEEEESINQPWWLTVFGFMNNVWGGFKSGLGKIKDKIKRTFGSNFGLAEGILDGAHNMFSDLKERAFELGKKALAGGIGALTKLGWLRSKIAEKAALENLNALYSFGGEAGNQGFSNLFNPTAGSATRRPMVAWTTGGGSDRFYLDSPLSAIRRHWGGPAGDRNYPEVHLGKPGYAAFDFSLAYTETGEIAGMPLYAPAPAKVISVEDWGAAEMRVILEDIKTKDRYHILHTLDVRVKPGQIVDGGTQLAVLGTGGGEYDPHLDIYTTKEYASFFIKSHIAGKFITFSDQEKQSIISKNEPAKTVPASTNSSNQSKPVVQTKHGHVKYKPASPNALVGVGELDAIGREIKLHKDAAASWYRMEAAAKRDGIDLNLASGYRSSYDQEILWRRAVQEYKSEAAAALRVAPPGYSQHETGYAIDLWQAGRTGQGEVVGMNFQNTPGFAWLQRNAAQYGFVLSFPKGRKNGADYEPWHWLYVGTEEAKRQYEMFLQAGRQAAVTPQSSANGSSAMMASASITNSAVQNPTPEIVKQDVKPPSTEKAVAQAQPAAEEQLYRLTAALNPTVLKPETSIEEIEERQEAVAKVKTHIAEQTDQAKQYYDKKSSQIIARNQTIEIRTNEPYDGSVHETGLNSKKPPTSIAQINRKVYKNKMEISVEYSSHESLPKHVTGFEETSEYTQMESALIA